MGNRIIYFGVVALVIYTLTVGWAYAQSDVPPVHDAARHRDDGVALHKNNQLPEAIAAYTRSLQMAPDPWVYLARAAVWRDLQELDNAIADCQRALSLDGKLATAYALRGACRLETKDFNRAIADFTIAIDLDPNEGGAVFGRAMLWFNLEEYDLALVDLNRTIVLALDLEDAYPARAICLQSAGKWKLAIDDWNRTIELRPNWLDAYVMRGKAQQEVAEFGAARADFEHAVRLDARSVEASNALAYFLTTCADERFRDYQRGISMATTSCQLSNWKDFRHLAMLATANGQAGQFAEAVRWQSAAIALAPDDQIRTMRERLDHFKSGAPTDSSRHP